jgi:glycosyltransferase involved in cell wall biosynthesis
VNILMISDVFFPRVNGVSTSIQTFRRALEGMGHTVTLIAPCYGTATADERGILRIPSLSVPFDPEDRFMRRRTILRLQDQLASERFDVLHIHTPFVAHSAGVRLARELGIPCVETYHTFFEEYLFHYVPFAPKSWMRWIAREFSRRQCNSVDRVIVPSRAMHTVLRTYGVEAAMDILPTGLRLEEMKAGEGWRFRARLGIQHDRPTLVFVGRVAFEKNIDFLLRVLDRVRERIPEVAMIIAGEGPAEGDLRRLVHRLDLAENVFFSGYLDRDSELMDCYCAGDAFVFASHTETQGLVLLEAMALGVPVVSTAVMGTVDLLEAGKGALVAKQAVDDFAAEVLRLLQDRDLQRQLSLEGRALAREWSADRKAQELAELYARLVAEGVGASGETRAERSEPVPARIVPRSLL